MSDDDAFLNAIREQPEDVVRRLVYADWLQERGDERHEMIRIETRMREIPIWSDEFQQLKPERKRLREKLPHEWLATMDYLPKHRPMFGTIPPTFEERWRLAEEFIDIWHGGLKPGDGYSEEEIQQAEKRLACRLPHALREWYKRAGKRTELWQEQGELYSFFSVERLSWSGDFLVIREYDSIDLAFALDRNEFAELDGTVYCFDETHEISPHGSCSDFILNSLLISIFPIALSGRYSDAVDSIMLAALGFTPITFSSLYRTDFWEGTEALLRQGMYGGEFYARTETAYQQLRELLPDVIIDPLAEIPF